MKSRPQTWIVLLAFAAGSIALVTGNYIAPGPRAPLVDALMQSTGGTWLARQWLDHGAPPAPAGLEVAGIGDHRINLSLRDSDGNLQQSSQWDGKLVLLNFWATWCEPCRTEMPLLNQSQQAHAGDGVQIVGIALDPVGTVKAWLAEHPSSYPILIDASDDHRAASQYANTRGLLPYSVLIGRDGQILKRKFGAFTAKELATWLQQ